VSLKTEETIKMAFQRGAKLSILLSLSVCVLITSGCAWLDTAQRGWIFQPSRVDASARFGMPERFEDVWIEVAAASPGAKPEKVHGWWVEHPDNRVAAKPSVLYLHGARWNITGSSMRIKRLNDAGFNVLAVDYRGFGKSEGELPSEQSAYDDAQAAWNWLKIKEPIASQRFVFGHSLGSAIAIDLASKNTDIAGLMVEAALTSIPDVVRQMRAGWLPVSGLITQRFESIKKIEFVSAPTLFIHGTADTVVPHQMSDALFAAARQQKILVKIEGAGHSGAAWQNFQRYREAIQQLVALSILNAR
jgi:uncharacterized protein